MKILEVRPPQPLKERELQFQLFQALKCSAKFANSFIVEKLKYFPIPNDFNHVKRIRKLVEDKSQVQILLTLCPYSFTEEQKEIFRDYAIDYEREIVIQIPKEPPISPEEALEWSCKYWPMSYKKKCEIWDRTEVKDCEELKPFFRKGDKKWAKLIFKGKIILSSIEEDIIENQHFPLDHLLMKLFDELSSLRMMDGNLYYATDCDLICNFEPCIMCGMALVHSRISRLFLIKEDFENFEEIKDGGAFLRKHSLHLNPSLNHHFLVYIIIL